MTMNVTITSGFIDEFDLSLQLLYVDYSDCCDSGMHIWVCRQYS